MSAVQPYTFAQNPPRIISVVRTSGEFRLNWTGTAPLYEVQRATDLSDLSWDSALTTSETNASVLLSGQSAFYRVVGRQIVDEQRRRLILDEINEKIDSLPGTDIDTDNQTLAQFLAGYAELSNIHISADKCVWSEFPDGRLLTLIGSRFPNGNLSTVPGGLASAPAPKQSLLAENGSSTRTGPTSVGLNRSAGPPSGLPKSSNVHLLSFLPVGEFNPVPLKAGPEMKEWLADYGYDVVQRDATLDALSAVQNAGVFYYEGHSALREDLGQFILVTATTIDQPISPLLQNDIGYGIIVRPRTPKIFYTITPAFVQKYMSFSDNSFVFINSCSGGNASAAPLRQACFARNASMFAGWTESAGELASWRAARYLFDRLLGSNRAGGAASPDFFETPAQRSFDYVSVLKAMHEHQPVPVDQTQVSGHPTAQLGFLPNPQAASHFGLLAPSIYFMQVDEEKEELHIYGIFDPQSSASVVVSGQALDVQDGNVISPTEIVRSLPATGMATSGQVWVFQGQRQSRSNRVPLTEWRVKAKLVHYFSPGQPQPSNTLEFDLHFRTDIHRTRTAPHVPPVFRGNSTKAARDSTCRLTSASGIYFDPNGIRTVEWSLPQPIDIPISYQSYRAGDTAFSASAVFDIDGVALTFGALAKDGITVKETISGKEFTSPFEPGTRTFPPAKASLLPLLYSIVGGESSAASDSGKASWETSMATSAPDENASGYGAGFLPAPNPNLK